MIQLKVTPARPIESEATEGEGTPETKETEKPSFIPKYLEDILEENGIEDIGVENVGKVLGDAAAFYKEAHPDCWLSGKADEYPKELRKAVNDITLLSFIKEKCKFASYFDEMEVNNIKRLTADTRENKRFGGLKALKFPFNVAAYLKDSANQIGEYFQTFLPEPMNKIEIPADFVPSPEPEKDTKQKLFNLPNAEAKAEVPQEHAKGGYTDEKLDVQQILEHGKLVNSFLYFRKKLLEVGVNPDLVVQKAGQVKMLIKAAKDLQQDEA